MRLLGSSIGRVLALAGLSVVTLSLAGCLTGSKPNGPTSPPPPGPTITTEVNKTIPLQNGDLVEVDLTGAPTTIPPLTASLSGAGTISLPLLETNVVAIGKTPHELEQIIHDLYVPKMYSTISVTVTPGQRYYYVSGQVNNTAMAKQPYTGRVTVLGAIAAGGGFNQFAAKKRVQLTRQDGTIYYIDCKKALKDPKLDMEVLPNDKIFVDQQTFWEAFFGQ